MTGYFGSAVVKSLKKIRNWLPLLPGGLETIATVPFGYVGGWPGAGLADGDADGTVGSVLVVERVGRPAEAGAAGVAAAQRALGGDLVALGVVVERPARQVGDARRRARGVGQVQLRGDRRALVGGHRHRSGAVGGQILGGRRADVLEVGVGRRVLRRPEAGVLRGRVCFGSESNAPSAQAEPATTNTRISAAPTPAWICRRRRVRGGPASQLPVELGPRQFALPVPAGSHRCSPFLYLVVAGGRASRPVRASRVPRHTPARVYG